MKKRGEQVLAEPLSGEGLLESAARFSELSMQASSIGERAVELAKMSAEQAKFAVASALEQFMADPTPLTAGEMQNLARDFPQWTVTTGINRGEAVKTYTRSLGDMHMRLGARRDIYLRFCDPEYFDQKLLDIFKTWGGDGDLGSFPHFTIAAQDSGPLTIGDSWKVLVAEQYLQDEGLFVMTAPEAQTQVAV